MKLYTRRGDAGETRLAEGGKVRKNEPRVEAYGAVDELNALLGLVLAETNDAEQIEGFQRIQTSLFDLGSELATPAARTRKASNATLPRVDSARVEELEAWIDLLDEELEPLRRFVLPGGSRMAALLHLARTVCRRAERRVVALMAQEEVEPVLGAYLNRLSDLFFTLARSANQRAGVAEVPWPGRGR